MKLADIKITDRKSGTFALESGGKPFAFCDDKEHAETIKRALDVSAHAKTLGELTAFVVLLTDDNRFAIADALEMHGGTLHGGSVDTGERLTAICREWRELVTARKLAETDEHMAKMDEEGPLGPDTRTNMHIRLDDDDHRDIMAAVELRKAWDCEPDSDSCDAGASIAEICRGWMERVEHDKQQQPRRTDNGDGTVTFHGIDVTVRADVLGGRDVVAVRRVESDERYIDSFGNAQTCFSGNDNRLHIILGPKPQALAQAFIEGCTYRDGKGNLCGPLVPSGSIEYPLKDQRGDVYTTDGKCRLARPDAMANLVPGEVIVWRHPGLKAGEYTWDGRLIKCGGMIVLNQLTSHHISAWTDPPRAGTWKVIQGQEYATWEGE